jgi:hypothetical protein
MVPVPVGLAHAVERKRLEKEIETATLHEERF